MAPWDHMLSGGLPGRLWTEDIYRRERKGQNTGIYSGSGRRCARHTDKRKINKFQITYEEGEFFYLASGYGERPSFGYNIKVNDLYSKGDVLYLDTTLTGPEEGAVVKKAPSYPFIVIKLKASGTDKKVEFIM